ncbi:Cytochrome P450 9e2, partial [Pseudolycoriella hygida]
TNRLSEGHFNMLLLLYAIIVTLFLLYELLKPKDDYFIKKGIPYMKPKFLIGSRHDLLLRNKPATETLRSWYNEFPNDKVSGLFEFSTPTYIVRDPKLLKKLTVKDFEYFLDHKNFIGEDVDPLFGRALFSLQGQRWKDMRATLSPAFTGSKMRQMFEFVSSVGQQVATTIKTQIKNGGEKSFEFKDLARKFTVDTIATCAFGIEVNSFENPKNDFHRIAGKVANFGSFTTILKFMGYFAAPKLMRLLKIKFFDEETTTFFQKAIDETIEAGKTNTRKGTRNKEIGRRLGRNVVTRKWDDADLCAQCFIFFFAGFDTVSTVMTFMSYELMANTDVQRRLQQEIDEMNEAIGGKRVNYEQIQGMKYMDQVVCETLRKWPPAPLVDRLCVKDYEMVYDDKKFTIEKGKNFYIPIFGIHHDARYYENPEKFDPDRFSEENRRNIDPDAYLPFGLGPRNCIGSRFALMELKTIIYYLLLNFDFVPTEKSQIPLKLANNPTQLQSEKGVWVGFNPRN